MMVCFRGSNLEKTRTISDDTQSTPPSSFLPPTHAARSQERRKSARLHKVYDPNSENDGSIVPHDSGTESDEEELQTITSRFYGEHLLSCQKAEDVRILNRFLKFFAWRVKLTEIHALGCFQLTYFELAVFVFFGFKTFKNVKFVFNSLVACKKVPTSLCLKWFGYRHEN